jgi:hypothetical protein
MLINLTNSMKDEEENFGTVTNSMGKKMSFYTYILDTFIGLHAFFISTL